MVLSPKSGRSTKNETGRSSKVREWSKGMKVDGPQKLKYTDPALINVLTYSDLSANQRTSIVMLYSVVGRKRGEYETGGSYVKDLYRICQQWIFWLKMRFSEAYDT